MWIAILVLIVFRWFLFERFIGTKYMYLLDAAMFTAFAAINFAQETPWPIVSFLVAALCAYLAFSSGRKFLTYEEKKEN